MEILQEKQSDLLGRKEYLLKCVFEKAKTPSKEELKKQSATLLKSPEDLIIVKKVAQTYGLNDAKVLVYVYKDQTTLTRIEKVSKKPKTKKAEETQQPAKK